MTNQKIQPFLKWAGGKRQLQREIGKYAPKVFHTYFEPFLGGGAVLFHLQPARAVINDVNAELVNTYRVIRDSVTELVVELSKHVNERDYFYALRELDRQPGFADLSPIQRAARLIYLNKTCFNGLFRVNSHGQFNVPYGDYQKPNIVNAPVLYAVHEYLVTHQIDILNADFEDAVASAAAGDFVYIDPPYHPVSTTSSFTGYSLRGFNENEQLRLKRTIDELSRRGCKVMLSNSATEFVKELYDGYRVIPVRANRAINSNAARRGKIGEVIVINYEPE